MSLSKILSGIFLSAGTRPEGFLERRRLRFRDPRTRAVAGFTSKWVLILLSS
jgi:hypothetical protein